MNYLMLSSSQALVVLFYGATLVGLIVLANFLGSQARRRKEHRL